MNEKSERLSLCQWLRFQWWRYKSSRQPKPGHFVDSDDIPGGTQFVHRGWIPQGAGETVCLSCDAPAAFQPYRLSRNQFFEVRSEVTAALASLGFNAVAYEPFQGTPYRCWFYFSADETGNGYLEIIFQTNPTGSLKKIEWWCSVFVPPEAKANMLQLYPKLIRRVLAAAPRAKPNTATSE